MLPGDRCGESRILLPWGVGMGSSQVAEEDVQLSLMAAHGHIGLAEDMLVSRLGLDRHHAKTVLEQGSGLLVERMSQAKAQSVIALLATLGLQAASRPCNGIPADETCAVSVRVSRPKVLRRVLATIERLVGVADLTSSDFAGPAGLVLQGVPVSRGDWLCDALRRLPGVSATMSEAASARYDLFAEQYLADSDMLALRDQLRLMGCPWGGFGDALACDLEARVVQRLLSRFRGLGLYAVDQAFQRHELVVIGRGHLSQTEFMDFMRTRPMAAGKSPGDLLRALPIKVEENLTRNAASQFLTDYQGIGIQAVTRLQHLAEAVR